MPNEREVDDAMWCEYCSEHEATCSRTVTTSDGARRIAVCKPCGASIDENGYAGVEYAPEVNEDYE